MASSQWIFSGPEWPAMLVSTEFTTDGAGAALVGVPGQYPVDWVGSSYVQGSTAGTTRPIVALLKGSQGATRTPIPNPQFPFVAAAQPLEPAQECNFLTGVGGGEQLYGQFTGLQAATTYRWQLLIRQPVETCPPMRR